MFLKNVFHGFRDVCRIVQGCLFCCSVMSVGLLREICRFVQDFWSHYSEISVMLFRNICCVVGCLFNLID